MVTRDGNHMTVLAWYDDDCSDQEACEKLLYDMGNTIAEAELDVREVNIRLINYIDLRFKCIK